MGKSILITGVPGTGKSSICEKLKDMGYQAYDIEEMKGMFSMVDPETGEEDVDVDNDDLDQVDRTEWMCNIEELRKLMDENQEGTTFYCGTSSNIDDVIPLFDEVFLLEVSEGELRERLSQREGNEVGADSGVRDWVLDWMDWWNDKVMDKDAIAVDGDRSIEEIIEDIVKATL